MKYAIALISALVISPAFAGGQDDSAGPNGGNVPTLVQPFFFHEGVDPAVCDASDDYNRPLKAGYNTNVDQMVRTASIWCLFGLNSLAVRPFEGDGGSDGGESAAQ